VIVLRFRLVWFDSMGAKSSCTYVSTRSVKLIIDPGIAIMHGTFPASYEMKVEWLNKGYLEIVKYLRKASHVVISHYHYDHYLPDDIELYGGKVLFVKNPNIYINDNQRERALRFFDKLYKRYFETALEDILLEHEELTFTNPLDELPHSMSLDLGNYNERRWELFEKGLKWFKNRVNKWNGSKFVPELRGESIEVFFAENRTFKIGNTEIRFTKPIFHGIEFSRVGWVFMTIITEGKKKLIHTSDINGPIIEDYADLIIREDPDILILDGPMTYMLGYTMNLINLRRVIKNIIRIIENTKANPIILDHHLPREKKFKERLSDVYKTAESLGKDVITAAEYYGREPVVLTAF